MINKQLFVKRLKEARENAGLRQNVLSEITGLSPQIISAYETGKKIPTLENAILIVEKLNISLDWLLGLTDELESKDSKKVDSLADIIEYADTVIRGLNAKCTVNCYSYYEQNGEMVVTGMVHNNGMVFWDKGPDAGRVYIASISFHNKIAVDFFRDYGKMASLLNQGVLSQDIFNAWLSGRVAELKSIQIPKEK